MQYDQLGRAARLSRIDARLKLLQEQHFDLSMKINSPDLNTQPNEMDQSNLAALEDSINKLNELKQSVSAES